MSMKKKDFNPATMKRASTADISRMWKRLWGSIGFVRRWAVDDFEYLDRIQLQAAGIGQGWVHTPSVEVPASGTPATNEHD